VSTPSSGLFLGEGYLNLRWRRKDLFKKLWLGTGAKSDTGFSVKLKGLHTIEYREGDRSLTAFRERLVGDLSMDIDSSSIESWLPPHESESIPVEKKQQILDNIRAALDFLGLTYVVR
jgi:hypothetical protein